MTLHCALCLSLLQPRQVEAFTVLNGAAVCRDHLGYMHLETLERSIAMARDREDLIEEAQLIERAFEEGDSSSEARPSPSE